MKTVVIAFTTALFFTVLFLYVSTTLSPWNMEAVNQTILQNDLKTSHEFTTLIEEIIDLGLLWQVIDLRNLLTWFFLFGFAIVSIFSSLHMLFDKLFFKRWFEKPTITNAIRRGLLFYLLILAILLLRLLAGLYWYNVIGVIALVIVIELVIQNIQSHKNTSSSSISSLPINN